MTQPTTDAPTIIKPKRLNKRQRKFMELWLGSPTEDTYGNAYKSAIQAGFSESSARTITGNIRNLQWIKDAKALYSSLDPQHIYLAMQTEALTAKASRDRITALTTMAKWNGMEVNRSETKVEVQFTNSVPRPARTIIEAEIPPIPSD